MIFKRFQNPTEREKNNNLWPLHPRCNHSKPNNCRFFYSSVPFILYSRWRHQRGKKHIQPKSEAPLITAIEIYRGIKADAAPRRNRIYKYYDKDQFTIRHGHARSPFLRAADARVKRFIILSLFWKFFYLMHYLLFPLLQLFICLYRWAICWC